MRAIRPALPWLLFALVVVGQLLVVGHVVPLAPRPVALDRSVIPAAPPASGVYDEALLLPDEDVNHVESHIAYLRSLTHEQIVVATFRTNRETIDQSGVRADAAWLRDQWWGQRDRSSGIVLLVEVDGTGTGGSAAAYATSWNLAIGREGSDAVTASLGDVFTVAEPRYEIEASLHVLEYWIDGVVLPARPGAPERALLAALLPFFVAPLAFVAWFERRRIVAAMVGRAGRGTRSADGRPERAKATAHADPRRVTERYWGMTDVERQAAFAADSARYPAGDGWRIASVMTEWPVGKPGLDLVVTYVLDGRTTAEDAAAPRTHVPAGTEEDHQEEVPSMSGGGAPERTSARAETGLRRGVLVGGLVALVTVSMAGSQDESRVRVAPHDIMAVLIALILAALIADLAWYAARSERFPGRAGRPLAALLALVAAILPFALFSLR